jgi:antirestriction protein ArdC
MQTAYLVTTAIVALYNSTLFHELTHATGHAKRHARDGFETPQKFGSESYSREELIAETGSALLYEIALSINSFLLAIRLARAPCGF